ncbi:MAG TPA: hypothetical protein PKC30_12275 [Saprospiraceae bacterium]|nr:hypothetical protein [Saprospiraceae bacterium]
MLKKIKASGVTNLTDARYFAAWGVEYIGFDIDPESDSFISPPQFKEISQWIEGPEIVIEMGSISDRAWLQEYTQYVENPVLQCYGANNLLSGFQWIEECELSEGIYNFTSPHVVIHTTKSANSLFQKELEYFHHITKNYNVFLDIPFSDQELSDLLKIHVHGWVVRGGREEKTGYKSFEELDHIFEKISDLPD